MTKGSAVYTIVEFVVVTIVLLDIVLSLELTKADRSHSTAHLEASEQKEIACVEIIYLK